MRSHGAIQAAACSISAAITDISRSVLSADTCAIASVPMALDTPTQWLFSMAYLAPPRASSRHFITQRPGRSRNTAFWGRPLRRRGHVGDHVPHAKPVAISLCARHHRERGHLFLGQMLDTEDLVASYNPPHPNLSVEHKFPYRFNDNTRISRGLFREAAREMGFREVVFL